MTIRNFASIVVLFLLSGCSSMLPSPTLLPPTETATRTATSTVTRVWFPPTQTLTPTPEITVTPTPELRGGQGEIILQDQFTKDSPWTTGYSSIGNMGFGNNELTLAVAQAGGSLLTLRSEPVLDNFYLEVTAETSLCKNNDAYGIIIRANSDYDYYRFQVNCNGQTRADRVVGGQTLPIKDWDYSGQVWPGAPTTTRLGVWAAGSELRFFVNDVFEYGVKDPIFTSGQIGFFAKSAGETALTVSFSDLEVREVILGAIPLTATPTSVGTPQK